MFRKSAWINFTKQKFNKQNWVRTFGAHSYLYFGDLDSFIVHYLKFKKNKQLDRKEKKIFVDSKKKFQ